MSANEHHRVTSSCIIWFSRGWDGNVCLWRIKQGRACKDVALKWVPQMYWGPLHHITGGQVAFDPVQSQPWSTGLDTVPNAVIDMRLLHARGSSVQAYSCSHSASVSEAGSLVQWERQDLMPEHHTTQPGYRWEGEWVGAVQCFPLLPHPWLSSLYTCLYIGACFATDLCLLSGCRSCWNTNTVLAAQCLWGCSPNICEHVDIGKCGQTGVWASPDAGFGSTVQALTVQGWLVFVGPFLSNK